MKLKAAQLNSRTETHIHEDPNAFNLGGQVINYSMKSLYVLDTTIFQGHRRGNVRHGAASPIVMSGEVDSSSPHHLPSPKVASGPWNSWNLAALCHEVLLSAIVFKLNGSPYLGNFFLPSFSLNMLAAAPEDHVGSLPTLLLVLVVPWLEALSLGSPIDQSSLQRFLHGENWGDDWQHCLAAEAALV